MLGHELVTKQTGPAGKTVKRLYIEEGCDIKRELYLSMLVDRAVGRIAVVASTEGGMDIETVAHEHAGEDRQAGDRSGRRLPGLPGPQDRLRAGPAGQAGRRLRDAARQSLQAFTELDCSLIEINPLVVTGGGRRDRARCQDELRRQRALPAQGPRGAARLDEEDPAETEAAKYALNYVKLDGQIGCMVNGAGLAMATMDIIKLYGSAPANFLDVGGGATKERVTAAFKIILKDPNVEGILVNIFGGIMRCDVIAEGVVAAAREVNLHVPLVVRLEGTNVELGKKILKESGLKITSAENLADAAEKIVKAVKEAN